MYILKFTCEKELHHPCNIQKNKKKEKEEIQLMLFYSSHKPLILLISYLLNFRGHSHLNCMPSCCSAFDSLINQIAKSCRPRSGS